MWFLSGPNFDHASTEIRQFIELFFVVYSEMRVALRVALLMAIAKT